MIPEEDHEAGQGGDTRDGQPDRDLTFGALLHAGAGLGIARSPVDDLDAVEIGTSLTSSSPLIWSSSSCEGRSLSFDPLMSAIPSTLRRPRSRRRRWPIMTMPSLTGPNPPMPRPPCCLVSVTYDEADDVFLVLDRQLTVREPGHVLRPGEHRRVQLLLGDTVEVGANLPEERAPPRR